MPAWPGGPCPQCGVDVPAMMIRCTDCRALLNTDLALTDVKVPAFVPLPEVGEQPAPVATPRGFYTPCNACGRPQRLNARYAGSIVRCKNCDSMVATPSKLEAEEIDLRLLGLYAECPHCRERMTFSPERLGRTVTCRSCDGAVRLEPTRKRQAATA